jgi:hypothetical protein
MIFSNGFAAFQLSMMNNSNKKLTLFTSPPSKLSPEHLPKSDVPKLILTLFAMEHKLVEMPEK